MQLPQLPNSIILLYFWVKKENAVYTCLLELADVPVNTGSEVRTLIEVGYFTIFVVDLKIYVEQL